MRSILLVACASGIVMGVRPSGPETGTDLARASAPQKEKAQPAGGAAEEEAVRVLMRHQKARIDGTAPPAAWPGKLRRVGTAWVADIDTKDLPGGYPQQIVVEVTTAGGHTGRPVR
jgi:hypothetical protein